MPLTPEDVHNKQFTTVRLREGYDEEEVDAFLDEVEAELTRLLRENEELRAKLAAATRAAAAAQQQPPMDRPPMDRQMDRMPARREPVPIPPQLPAPMPVPVPQPQPPQFQPGGDSAARVLALAQQTADQAIAEARNEANKIVGEARTRADGMEREARGKADALERDAQEKHRVAIGTLEQARASLERKVEDLRAFEREYRQRLKSYLESQMRQLESNSSDDAMLASRGGSPFPQLGPGAPVPAQASAPSPAMVGAGMAPPPGSQGFPPPMPAPAMAGSAMSQMTQTMAPIRPGVPPQPAPVYPQAPSPMRGFLIDEDPDS
ncbi:MAG TPA: DivIVA domain-containing protein [Actinocrinis sp.]|uniref:DivIVA domain-containing protein n=1 Tax=Actinocrinis sp. TaxID=1920516 RepID=UPI002DDD0E92|nr:DivIVA domain-containing protein [Actinocrinis sp.]HEV2343941.1 DivIVA domain-containing protein [Actinocrinis sp.]